MLFTCHLNMAGALLAGPSSDSEMPEKTARMPFPDWAAETEIATAMKSAMRPYSIDVEPALQRAIARKIDLRDFIRR